MSGVTLWIASGLSIWLTYELYHFHYVYRRMTGDRSYPYLSSNQARVLSLLFRRHSIPEFRRLQLRFAIAFALWIALALYLVATFNPPTT